MVFISASKRKTVYAIAKYSYCYSYAIALLTTISIPSIGTAEVGHAPVSFVDLSSDISAVDELESLVTNVPQAVHIQRQDHDANLSLEEKIKISGNCFMEKERVQQY